MSESVRPPRAPPYTSDPPPPYQVLSQPNPTFNGPETRPIYHTVVLHNQMAPRPHDYLGLSIFSLLCCCLPIGLAALIFSLKTRVSLRLRDFNLAKEYSRHARNLNIAAIVVGALISTALIVFLPWENPHFHFFNLSAIHNLTQSHDFTM